MLARRSNEAEEPPLSADRHVWQPLRSRRRARWPDWRYVVFVFISHLTVPEADHADLERHFHERSRLVDAFPGFLYLQLLKPQAGTATHTFLTTWADADAFRRYMRSQERAASHSREPGEIMTRTTVRHEAYEVLLDSRDAVR